MDSFVSQVEDLRIKSRFNIDVINNYNLRIFSEHITKEKLIQHFGSTEEDFKYTINFNNKHRIASYLYGDELYLKSLFKKYFTELNRKCDNALKYNIRYGNWQSTLDNVSYLDFVISCSC